MIKVHFPLGPNAKNQAHRGVGRYHLYLSEAVAKTKGFEVVTQAAQADIVHYTYFDLFFHTLPIFPGLKKHQRQIVTIHDVIPLVFPEQYRPGKKGSLAFQQQLMALKKVDLVITDSLSSQKDIQQYLKYPLEQIKVVYLAANPHLQPPSDSFQAEIKRRYHLNFPYLLYVGDINYNKNIPQLIKAFKFLPDKYHLVCVGKNFVPQEIPEWQAISQQIDLSEMTKRVHFLPQILGDDADKTLSALYGAAVCYVQPSLYEGFGLPILEAMQCHTPVVAVNNSSQPEVANKHALLASDGEALSLATATKEILAWSPETRSKKIAAAAKYAAKFSWRKVAKDTTQLYQELLGSTL